MSEQIQIKMAPGLRALIVEIANREDATINEVAVKLLAKQLGHPELGFVPRKRMGRPRKELQATR